MDSLLNEVETYVITGGIIVIGLSIWCYVLCKQEDVVEEETEMDEIQDWNTINYVPDTDIIEETDL